MGLSREEQDVRDEILGRYGLKHPAGPLGVEVDLEENRRQHEEARTYTEMHQRCLDQAQANRDADVELKRSQARLNNAKASVLRQGLGVRGPASGGRGNGGRRDD